MTCFALTSPNPSSTMTAGGYPHSCAMAAHQVATRFFASEPHQYPNPTKREGTTLSPTAENQEVLAQLSTCAGREISHLDMMLLFLEVMKLEIKSGNVERQSRLHERLAQIEHMKEVVENYKQQAGWQKTAGLSAGLMMLCGAAAPVIGHVKGDWLLENLQQVWSGFHGMKRATAVEMATNMLTGGAKMAEATGQVQTSLCESTRVWDESESQTHRSDGEEKSHTYKEYGQNFQAWQQVLKELYRMEQTVVQHLYGA